MLPIIKSITFRKLNLYIFFVCAASLVSALIIEHYFFLPPCPLCTLQRICYLSIAIFSFIGFIHYPKFNFKYFYLIVIIFFSLIGFSIAGWQVWLQYFHDGEVLSCSQGLLDLLSSNKFLEVFEGLFSPNIECSDKSFAILGLTIAVWSLLLFLGLTIAIFFGIILTSKRKWD